MSVRSDQYSLVIGRLPADSDDILSNSDHCDGIFEALARVQTNDYDVIYLVLADIPEPRQKALETLADLAPQSQRCLLVDMIEEPQALHLGSRLSK